MTESAVFNAVPETDRLDPVSDIISLQSGQKVRILPLKMRQLFRLLRIITRGGASYLPMLRDALLMNTADEQAAEIFGTQLLAIAMISLPEAEDEAVEFLMSVVEPDGLPVGSDKRARERADEMRSKLAVEMENPDPEDVVTIVEAVILREKDDLVALGKRLQATFKVAMKTGQIDQKDVESPASSEQTPPSSAGLPEHSISSPPSTDGQTPSS